MRIIASVVACVCMSCSGSGSVVTEAEVRDGGAHTSQHDGPPVITFVSHSSSVDPNADGSYTLSFVVTYFDDFEDVTTFDFHSQGCTYSGRLPVVSAAESAVVSLVIPGGTPSGLVQFKLDVASSSGVASSPFTDTVLLNLP